MAENNAPVDAATLIFLRDTPDGIVAFFVQRSPHARFMGGHLVFPGGRVDDPDRTPDWLPLCSPLFPVPAPDLSPPDDETTWRALGIAACREALEESALLPATGKSLTHTALLELRRRLDEEKIAFRDLILASGLRIDLASLHPLSRWVTPKNQSTRFDTRFFVTRALPGQEGAHDEHETVASFWATPREVLDRHEAKSIQLAPPTHRTLEILSKAHSVDEVFAYAARASLSIICPELVPHADDRGEALALTLPGDPEHSVSEVRIEGTSRYVLREGFWRPASPPRR
ncbi:MAG TPA: hypothetical protein VNO21_04615 [Polyangiaceae bacterium]|nr:hypothetical protein [Polyangiaceae bacterium]